MWGSCPTSAKPSLTCLSCLAGYEQDKAFVCGNNHTSVTISGGQHHCHESCISLLACVSRDRDLSTTPATICRDLPIQPGQQPQPRGTGTIKLPEARGTLVLGISILVLDVPFASAHVSQEKLPWVLWLRVCSGCKPQWPQWGISQADVGHCRHPLPSALASSS